ncbi:Txe/YoeB family addiction module toxin [Thiotrichales bacterium HSG1]|nr:Txe/YoeB family addiction module toxin [Thiotrichales bacterium HSG1]
MRWKIILSRQATKDAKKLARTGYKFKTEKLLKIIEINPYQNPPPYEKLVGNLHGFYSRRITIQHRLIYSILDTEKVIHVLRMWTHYE